MKVLLLCDKPPWPGTSGGAIATQSVIRNITDAGINLTIFYLNTNKHCGDNKDIPPEILRTIRAFPIKHDTTLSPMKAILNLLFSDKPYNLERFYSTVLKRELTDLLTKEEFDIIQVEGLAMNIYFNDIRPLCRYGLVMRAHNVEHEIWNGLANESAGIFKRFYLKNLASRIRKSEEKYLPLYDGMVTISETDLNKFRASGINTRAITLYPVPAISPVSGLNKRQRPFTIGYLGSLDWLPNVNGLIWFLEDVWPQLAARSGDHRFIIGGRNPSRDLIKRISKAGAEYIGEPGSSADFLDSADLIVIPLFSGSGIRIKIIEALLSRTQVITTTKGAEGIPSNVFQRMLIADDATSMVYMIEEEFRNHTQGNNSGEGLFDEARYIFNNLAGKENLSAFYRSLVDGK